MTAPTVSTRLGSIASSLEAEAAIADRPGRYEALASLADEVRQLAREAEEALGD